MEWIWSDAGKLRNGEPYKEFNSDSSIEYQSIKGTFRWARDIKPDYIWFNGTADHYLIGDTIREVPVKMNTLFGSHEDGESKITPVKINIGDQIYDTKYKTLIQPKLFSLNKGDSAYWKDFDWNTASAAGMKRVGLPFSGHYDFVETVMYWPINHMVSPKDQSVGCAECHTRRGGRLEKLTGFTAEEVVGCNPPYPWWREGTQQEFTQRLLKAMRVGTRKYESLYLSLIHISEPTRPY